MEAITTNSAPELTPDLQKSWERMVTIINDLEPLGEDYQSMVYALKPELELQRDLFHRGIKLASGLSLKKSKKDQPVILRSRAVKGEQASLVSSELKLVKMQIKKLLVEYAILNKQFSPTSRNELKEKQAQVSHFEKIKATRFMLVDRLEEHLQPEARELLYDMETQHTIMIDALNHYGISTTSAPCFEDIRWNFGPYSLAAASHLQEPILLLIPPTTKKSKFEAIQKHKISPHWQHVFDKMDDDSLWNGGQEYESQIWKVAVVEGTQNLDQASSLKYNDDAELIKQLIIKLEKQDLSVMNDANTYLTLVIRKLVEGKPIDNHSTTILNPLEFVTKKAKNVAIADYDEDTISLFLREYSYLSDKKVRGMNVRGIIEIRGFELCSL